MYEEKGMFSDFETVCNSHDYSGEYGSYHGEQDVRAPREIMLDDFSSC